MAVGELERVVGAVRSSTAKHYARLQKFQNQIAKLGTQQGDVVWHELCREIEGILDPTLQLVSEIANAQERIRYQSNYLMTFSEVRTDPLTQLGNRRMLDCVLGTQFSLFQRYGTPFSLAILDIDHFKDINDQQGHLYGDQALRDLTAVLVDTSRTVDVVARYGGDEFVVVMPQTDIAGAGVLGERLRARVEHDAAFTVSVGTASANDSDTPESLFQRADAALYQARTAGGTALSAIAAERLSPLRRRALTTPPHRLPLSRRHLHQFYPWLSHCKKSRGAIRRRRAAEQVKRIVPRPMDRLGGALDPRAGTEPNRRRNQHSRGHQPGIAPAWSVFRRGIGPPHGIHRIARKRDAGQPGGEAQHADERQQADEAEGEHHHAHDARHCRPGKKHARKQAAPSPQARADEQPNQQRDHLECDRNAEEYPHLPQKAGIIDDAQGQYMVSSSPAS